MLLVWYIDVADSLGWLTVKKQGVSNRMNHQFIQPKMESLGRITVYNCGSPW